MTAKTKEFRCGNCGHRVIWAEERVRALEAELAKEKLDHSATFDLYEDARKGAEAAERRVAEACRLIERAIPNATLIWTEDAHAFLRLIGKREGGRKEARR